MLFNYVQTHHSEPDGKRISHLLSGGMKHSRLVNCGFTWPKVQERALRKQKHRAIHLARCNPDYQIEHPEEVRCNPESKILDCCHPEASKRIEKRHVQILQKVAVPTVDRPKRYNRNG